ncbi:hypothetical protein IPA_03800 [Ignicoccus pacificus DSM 13166]|uniref:ATP-grasp fold RimK-type domain-containing protein n=1 Tax=Ignicoccus pacificus DSM 13166 TaxID=940294 RepID=A0A977PKU7_9CREN|nr:hypothetical protein IPA_03800 [Ignicoccus pacificus DSM 13166]
MRDVERALRELGHSVKLLSFDQLECSYIHRFDLVLLRGLPYDSHAVELNSLLTCLTLYSITINDPRAMLNARDKFTSMKILENKGVPVPKTFLVKSKAELFKLLKVLDRVVLKPVSGSLGLGILDLDITALFYSSLPPRFVAIVQERLDKVRDVRVLATRNKAIAAMYRVAPLSFVSNYWMVKEADPAPVELYEEVAVKAIRALGLHYGGVDLIETPEGPKVIEVNPSPLWEGLKKVSKRDVVKELLEDILGDEIETGSDL